MTDDLVKRLRRTYCKEFAPTGSMVATPRTVQSRLLSVDVLFNPDGVEAADRIEALTAENERLRAECDTYKVALAAIIEPRIGGGEWAASVARKALTQHLANNATIGDLELPRRLVKHLGAEEPATLVFDILEDKKHRLWSNIGYRDERIMREVAAFLDPARAALGDTQ